MSLFPHIIYMNRNFSKTSYTTNTKCLLYVFLLKYI